MAVGGMGSAQPALHSQQFSLSRREQGQPFGRKPVVRVVLKEQQMLAVVTKEGMAVAVAAISAAAVPTLPVKDQNAACRRDGPADVLDLHPFRRTIEAAFMRARHDA